VAIDGTSGNDILNGTDGPDVINGFDGGDELYGKGDNDELYGGDGTDLLDGGLGDDLLDGGAGDDVVSYGGATNGITVDLSSEISQDTGWGWDRIISVEGLVGTAFGDSITGSGRAEMIDPRGGDNVVHAMGGDDTIIGNYASGLLDGGEGSDWLLYANAGSINVDLAVTVAQTVAAGRSQTIAGIENVLGSLEDDVIAGDGFANFLIGYHGNDEISGRGGIDQLDGGAGDDLLSGGDDSDTLWGDGVAQLYDNGNPIGSDHLLGGGGDDELTGGGGVDWLEGGSGDDLLRIAAAGSILDGGDGFDTAPFGHLSVPGGPGAIGLIIDMATPSASSGWAKDTQFVSIEMVSGTVGADTIHGTTGAETLAGLGGNDQLYGRDGDDTLIGGEHSDLLDGGAGADLADYSRLQLGFYNVIVNLSSDRFLAPSLRPMEPVGARDVGPGEALDSYGHYDSLVSIENVTTGSGDDWVVGSAAANEIRSGSGNDLVEGEGGDDVLTGGSGADSLYGGAGADTVDYSRETGGGANFVNLSDNLLFGPNGHVPARHGLDTHGTIDSLDGIENVRTGSGGDLVFGSAGPNRIETGDGDDHIYAGAGIDTLIGGDGDDRYVIAAEDSATFEDIIIELDGGGIDQITTSLPSFSLAAFPHIEWLTGYTNVSRTLIGNDRDNYIGGHDSPDTLEGGLGNDVLEGLGGADILRGGVGDDFYGVDNIGDVVEENAGEGTDGISTSLASYSLFGTQVENLSASSNIAHDFRGSAAGNVIFGAGGNDFLRLHDGGDDEVYGGAGNDVILFGAAMTWTDFVNGGAGLDQLALQGNYAGGSALLFGGGVVSIENIAILPGDDTRFGDPGTNHYDYSLTLQDSTVAPGIQMVIDGNRLRAGEDLTFDGSAESDGSFFIYGGGGTDILFGGANNDVFLFGAWGQWNPADVVVGGAGIDQLALRGNYSLTFGAGQLFGIENIGLLSAHDTRFGALGSSYSYDLNMVDANVASGVQMVVDGAKLRVAEFFRFDGSAELDGSFRVFGGLVDDTIIGSRNNDFLQGNGGSDTLTGGDGADIFRYLATSDSTSGAADRILDFTPGTDKIDLSRIDANSHSAGDQAFSWIGANAFTGSGAASAGELRAFQSGQSWFVEGDTDGDGDADLLIDLILAGPTPLGAGDFLP
jgi:Ca2+-binding RTX toxin-like protein